jgi:uncharacterized protein
MEIVDFFRFPIAYPNESNLFKLNDNDLYKSLDLPEKSNIKHAMLALFDSTVIYKSNQVNAISNASISGDFSFTYMPNLDIPFSEEQLNAAFDMGCCSIVLHPYLQKIDGTKIERVKQLTKHAASIGMFVCVCCAYGGRHIFEYYPLRTVAAVAESIEIPIIIVHGGGAKILDAFLIAESFPNIYLETSFSLQYWLGSSIEKDFAFAIRRLGVERCLFGSDSPFMQIDDSIEAHITFLNRHNFNENEVKMLMGQTAKELLGI